MNQQIRFCTTSDGVRIAYATVGEGPPLILAWGWIGHLQFEWDNPDWRVFLEGLARGRQLVHFDKRGTGLSDWKAPDLSIEGQVRDLETVVDASRLKRFALMGISEGGPTAIMYAARHPERVSHLVLYGSQHRWHLSPEIVGPLAALVRAQWGMGAAALTDLFVPAGDPAKAAMFKEFQRVSASGENAARWLEAVEEIDMTRLLGDLRVPALVIHRQGDRVCRFKVGREMATLIPGAHFEPLEGDIHVPFWGDTRAILDAVDRFLPEVEGGIETEALDVALGAPLTLVFTDIEGSAALTQRLGDSRAQEILRAHNTIVREALRAHGGFEVKSMGDGFMASFPSASRALECAVTIQRAVQAWNQDVGAALAPPQGAASSAPTEAIRVRIGLNAGEPIAEEEDLFGTAVIMAARIAAKAEGGEILASNVVRELVAGKGFLFSDRGDMVLRGFEDPVRLYEVRWRDTD
jgi:class 3 adenylate cyclase/pimeloyl-ACP methyl ester carboxylesterase